MSRVRKKIAIYCTMALCMSISCRDANKREIKKSGEVFISKEPNQVDSIIPIARKSNYPHFVILGGNSGGEYWLLPLYDYKKDSILLIMNSFRIQQIKVQIDNSYIK